MLLRPGLCHFLPALVLHYFISLFWFSSSGPAPCPWLVFLSAPNLSAAPSHARAPRLLPGVQGPCQAHTQHLHRQVPTISSCALCQPLQIAPSTPAESVSLMIVLGETRGKGSILQTGCLNPTPHFAHRSRVCLENSYSSFRTSASVFTSAHLFPGPHPPRWPPLEWITPSGSPVVPWASSVLALSHWTTVAFCSLSPSAYK